MSIEMVSQRRGYARYQLLSFFIYIAAGVLFVGITTLSLVITQPVDLRVGAAIFYAISTAVLARVLWFGSVGGRTLWHGLVQGLPDEWQHPLGKSPRPPLKTRSLVSYLLLPRPVELIVKGPILIGAMLLSGLAGHALTSELLWSAMIIFIAFEFLFYQARYIWNDLRGLEVDAQHPEKRRVRFPQPARQQDIIAAIAVILARVLLTCWLATRVLPDALGVVLLAAAAIVLLNAVVYEALRERVSVNGTVELLKMTTGKGAILQLVGVGYAIRACLGICVGDVRHLDVVLLALTAIGFTSLGSMFVTMTWATDGLTHVRPSPDGQLPTTRCTRALLRLRHLGPLLRQARILDDPVKPVLGESDGTGTANPLGETRVLRPVHSLGVWWNWNFVIAAAVSAMVGMRLGGGRPLDLLAIPGIIGAVAGVVIVRLYSFGHRHEADDPRPSTISLAFATESPWALATMTTGSAAILLSATAAGASNWLLSWIPFCLVGVIYMWFRHASLSNVQLKRSKNKAEQARSGESGHWPPAHSPLALLLTPYTAKLLWKKQPRGQPQDELVSLE